MFPCTYFQFVNLALLVILELVNVLLQLLDLSLGLLLPSFRRFDRFLEIGDGLLQSFDVGTNLKTVGYYRKATHSKLGALTLAALLPSTCCSSKCISCSLISSSLASFFHFSLPGLLLSASFSK